MDIQPGADAVSQAVFLFQGNKTGKQKSKASGASSRQEKACQSAITQVTDHINESVQHILLQENAAILDKLQHFMRTRGNVHCNTTGPSFGILPTALLFAGVNTPDHEAIFDHISASLSEAHEHDASFPRTLVATLRARDCSSITNALSSVVQQLFEATDREPPVHKASNHYIEMLTNWFEEMVQEVAIESQDSVARKGKKRKRDEATGNPDDLRIVICMADFAAFPQQVASSLLYILSQHRRAIPFVVLMGLSTAVSSLRHRLPTEITVLLETEKLLLQHSVANLSAFIEKVLVRHHIHSFRIGHAALGALIDNFLLYNFTLQSFTRQLEFLVLEHFIDQPSFAHLSMASSATQFSNMVMGKGSLLGSEQVEDLRRTKSFRTYIDGQIALLARGQVSAREAKTIKEHVRALFLEDDVMKEQVVEWAHDVLDWQQRLPIVYDCFRDILQQTGLTRYTHARDLYLDLLSPQGVVRGSAFYSQLEAKFRTMSIEALKDIARECRNRIVDSGIESLQDLASKIEEVMELQESEEDEGDKGEGGATEGSRKRLRLGALRSYTDPRIDRYVDLIADMGAALGAYSDLPMHEIFFCDQAVALKRAFSAPNRAAIQTALSRPGFYAPCACCGDHHALSPSMHDTVIAFKLYETCGRLVSLYDWYQSFRSIVRKGEGIESDDENDSMEDEEEVSPERQQREHVLQARFSRAVNELQLLGFLRPTQRKTDHVIRLAFGNV